MSFEIATIPNFVKELKHLFKKYPSIKQDIERLGELLSENPFQGDKIAPNSYKIRVAIGQRAEANLEVQESLPMC